MLGDQTTLLLLFIGICVGVILVSIACRQRARLQRQREQALTGLARRLGGNLIEGSFRRQPKLTFEYKGYAAGIEYYSTGGRHPTLYTRLSFYFRKKLPYSVHICPERLFSKIGKCLGDWEIQIGDASFDDKFMVKGLADARVKAMLTPDVRRAMFDLRALNTNDHIELSTGPTTLEIQKLSWLQTVDLLVSMVTLGQQIFDGYLTAAAGANARAPASSEKEEHQTRIFCVVCREMIEGSITDCPICGAHHHPECYDLNDGCGSCS